MLKNKAYKGMQNHKHRLQQEGGGGGRGTIAKLLRSKLQNELKGLSGCGFHLKNILDLLKFNNLKISSFSGSGTPIPDKKIFKATISKIVNIPDYKVFISF